MYDLKRILFKYGETEEKCEITKETRVIVKNSFAVFQNLERNQKIGHVSSIKHEEDGIVIYFQLKEKFKNEEFSDEIDFSNDPEMVVCKDGKIKEIQILNFSLAPIQST